MLYKFTDGKTDLLHNKKVENIAHYLQSIIGGHPQKEGKEFFGKVIKADEDEFEVEIQDAYDVDVENVTRSFSMLEKGIKMTDSFIAEDNEIIERFVSLTKPGIEADGVHIGNAVLICNETPVITTQSIMSHSRTEVIVYLIDFIVNNNEFEIEISLKKRRREFE